jgi:hypothetical protein
MYIVVQFVLLLAFVSYFLFGIAKFSLMQQLTAILFIVFTSINIGALFENKKWAKIAESIRIFSAVPVLYILLFV